MKYTVISPETDQRLATVEQKSVSTFDAKGQELKHELKEFDVVVSSGRLEMSGADGSRFVFPATSQSADGSMTIATVLGSFKLLASRGAALEGAGGTRGAHKSIKSSMPGKVLKLLCNVGDKVQAGQPLMIIEAMKMENEILAPQAGLVEEIAVQPGKSIQTGELLVKLGTAE